MGVCVCVTSNQLVRVTIYDLFQNLRLDIFYGLYVHIFCHIAHKNGGKIPRTVAHNEYARVFYLNFTARILLQYIKFLHQLNFNVLIYAVSCLFTTFQPLKHCYH